MCPASKSQAMAEFNLHQSLTQQQTLAPQMRKSLEILQAGTMELSQIITQALEANPVLEDVTESISLDEEGPDPEEMDSLDYLNETDDDWRDREIMEGKSAQWTAEDEERRQRLYDSIVAPETLQQHLQQQLDCSSSNARARGKASNPTSCGTTWRIWRGNATRRSPRRWARAWSG